MKRSRRNFTRLLVLSGAGISLPPSLQGMTDSFYLFDNTAAPALQPDPWKVHFFSKHLQFLDYREMAETCAMAGMDGVDLTVRAGGFVLPEHVERDLPVAAGVIRNAGLELVMMTTGITDPDDPLTLKILRSASELGIKYYRMGYYRYDPQMGMEENLGQIRKKMGKLAAVNEKYGLHGEYQNHSGSRFGGPVWDIWEVLRDLDPRWIGCQYDIRHAVVEGAQSWPLALRLLRDYVRTMVIKDFHWEETGGGWQIKSVPLGQGMVDFNSFFKTVRELHISGPLSLHIEYPLYDELAGTTGEKKKSARMCMQQDLATLNTILKISSPVSSSGS